MRLFCFLLGLAGICRAGCAPVAGALILGRDLAAAEARFEAIPGAAVLGFAPAPGATRFFRPADLKRLAAQFHLSAEGIQGICFSRQAWQLDSATVNAAVRKALLRQGLASVEADLLDFSRGVVPVGDIVMGPAPRQAGEAIWRGRIVAGGASVQFWVRVRLIPSEPVCGAVVDLPQGKPVDAAQIGRIPAPPRVRLPVTACQAAEFTGRSPIRHILQGTVLAPEMFQPVIAGRRGEEVSVDVFSGGTRLKFSGVLESDAAAGQRVRVRNPVGGRLLMGTLITQGRVVVMLGGVR